MISILSLSWSEQANTRDEASLIPLFKKMKKKLWANRRNGWTDKD